jgi:hypothetical protein
MFISNTLPILTRDTPGSATIGKVGLPYLIHFTLGGWIEYDLYLMTLIVLNYVLVAYLVLPSRPR